MSVGSVEGGKKKKTTRLSAKGLLMADLWGLVETILAKERFGQDKLCRCEEGLQV